MNDFPGGAGRLCVRAEGYAATLVNGQVVTEQGEHTGARPGKVLREFARGDLYPPVLEAVVRAPARP